MKLSVTQQIKGDLLIQVTA